MPSRAGRWRSLRTAPQRSSVGHSTIQRPAPRGCTRAAEACGRSRAASWSAQVPWGLTSPRATRWRSRRTGTPRSSAGPATTPLPAPHGYSRASGGCGRSRGASWLARTPSEARFRATRWRCPQTAAQPSSAGMATTLTPAPHGCLRGAGACGHRRGANWSAPVLSAMPPRAGR